MSRSRRRNPITGVTTAETEKRFKQAEHRRERAAARTAMAAGTEPPPSRGFGDPWKGDKDGKQFHACPPPSLLRK